MATHRYLGMASIIACLFLLPGCKDSQESLFQELLATINQMTSTLEGVTDEASAKAAQPKMQKLMDKMPSLQKRAEALPKPNDSEKTELRRKYEAQTQEAMLKFAKEMMRVALNPKLNAAVKDLKTPGK